MGIDRTMVFSLSLYHAQRKNKDNKLEISIKLVYHENEMYF